MYFVQMSMALLGVLGPIKIIVLKEAVQIPQGDLFPLQACLEIAQLPLNLPYLTIPSLLYIE